MLRGIDPSCDIWEDDLVAHQHHLHTRGGFKGEVPLSEAGKCCIFAKLYKSCNLVNLAQI